MTGPLMGKLPNVRSRPDEDRSSPQSDNLTQQTKVTPPPSIPALLLKLGFTADMLDAELTGAEPDPILLDIPVMQRLEEALPRIERLFGQEYALLVQREISRLRKEHDAEATQNQEQEYSSNLIDHDCPGSLIRRPSVENVALVPTPKRKMSLAL